MINKYLCVCFIIYASISLGDTPPPGTVKAKMFTGDGSTGITATGTALDVNITNGGATSTVNQGLAGSQSWLTSITSSALPVNACQETGGHLASIDSKLTAPLSISGTVGIAGTVPVTGTFWQSTQPVSLISLPALSAGSATIGNVGVIGTVPVSGTFFQATQPISGNVGINGTVPVSLASTIGIGGTVAVSNFPATQPVSAAALPLPSGAATSALQTTINSTLGSPFQAGGSIGNTAFGISGTLPAFAATPTFNLGTLNGAATSALQTTGNTSIASIDSKTPVLGQALASASIPAVLPIAQITALTPPTTVTVTQATGTNLHAVIDSGSLSVSNFPATQTVSGTVGIAGTVPVTGTFFQATQPVSGTVGIGTTVPVTGTFWQTTQPVSLASLPPLVAGAATIGNVGIIGTVPISIGSVVGIGGTVAVSNFPATQPVSGTVGIGTTVSVTGTFFQATQPVSGTVGIGGTVATKAPINANATLSARQTVTGTETNLIAPSNAVGVILECESVNVDNLRWGFSNSTSTILSSTLGMLCEPGRDSAYIPMGIGTYLHMISTGAGSDFMDVQWVQAQ